MAAPKFLEADHVTDERCPICGNSRADGHRCLSPTQWDFVTDERRFVAMVSGRNCGKTYAALCRLATIFGVSLASIKALADKVDKLEGKR